MFGPFVPADHGIARIVRLVVEIQPLFHRGHEGCLAHRRIAMLHSTSVRFSACGAQFRSRSRPRPHGLPAPEPAGARSRAHGRRVVRTGPAAGAALRPRRPVCRAASWRHQRPTRRAEPPRAAAIASSVQPSPSGLSSHCNRTRTRSIFHPAGPRHPQRPWAIRVSHCRSDEIRRRTYGRDMENPRLAGQ